MDISKAFKEERIMKALTGITIPDFYRTATSLNCAIWAFYANQGLIIPIGKDRKSILPTMHLKLFFILFHLRFNPSHPLLGFLFGMSSQQVRYWLKKLTPHLSRILCHKLQPYSPKIKSIAKLIAIVPEIEELLSVAHKVHFYTYHSKNYDPIKTAKESM